MQKCSHCNTTYREITQTGFVGCQYCYEEIDELQLAIQNMFKGKTHKGRRARNGSL